MHFFAPLVLLATLASAGPLLAERQAPRAKLVSVDISGDGCPVGSFRSQIFGDGETASIAFTRYNLSTAAGQPSSLPCVVLWTVNFPVGCTNLTFDNVYSGSADGEVSLRINGFFHVPYSLSGGTLPPNIVTTSIVPPTWPRRDRLATVLRVVNQNERNHVYRADTRLELQRLDQRASGSVTLDLYEFSIVEQTGCV